MDGEPFDLDRALAGVRGRSRCLILTHNNPDPDALASAEGLKVLLEREAALPCTVGTGGVIGRAENRAMIRLLGLQVTPARRVKFSDFDTVALVDTQPGTGNNPLPPGLDPAIVIDHHPRLEAPQVPPWLDVRAGLGATSSIVVEYLRRRGIPLEARLATALFYGIVSDTLDLGRNATDAEREAYFALLPLADLQVLSQIRVPDLSFKYYRALTEAIERAVVFGQDMASVALGTVPYPELPAEIADFLLRGQGIYVAFCTGLFGGDLHLSLRSARPDLNAGTLIRQVAQPLGNAGGHESMAGGVGEMVPESNARALGESLARRLASFLGLPAESRRLLDLA
jgi:nanoRNase/pAp phosphatase (c-di-AMP/oligoRNAs hydrolase)